LLFFFFFFPCCGTGVRYREIHLHAGFAGGT
jgi:hypothetical protein